MKSRLVEPAVNFPPVVIELTIDNQGMRDALVVVARSYAATDIERGFNKQHSSTILEVINALAAHL